VLIFTGLRNEALTNLQVKHINFDKSFVFLNYDTKKINSKHKVQIIPIPPLLLKELEQHVRDQQLLSHDKLLFGLAGQPLGEKALNRLTNRLSHDLGWKNDQRVTPHGFRATISTLLSERGIDIAAIKFLLGHSEQDNLQFYIRRFGRHIRQLQRELTKIEEELAQVSEGEVINTHDNPQEHYVTISKVIVENPKESLFPREMLLRLLETDPELAVILIRKGLAYV
jgi:integrase